MKNINFVDLILTRHKETYTNTPDILSYQWKSSHALLNFFSYNSYHRKNTFNLNVFPSIFFFLSQHQKKKSFHCWRRIYCKNGKQRKKQKKKNIRKWKNYNSSEIYLKNDFIIWLSCCRIPCTMLCHKQIWDENKKN